MVSSLGSVADPSFTDEEQNRINRFEQAQHPSANGHVVSHDTADPFLQYKKDPFLVYLWKGYHAECLNDEKRLRRVQSVKEVRTLMPQSGFLPEYLKYVLPMSDAAPIYHLMSALAVNSMVVNRKAWIPWQDKKLYANLWLALVGPSGIRKSTAIHHGMSLLLDTEFARAVLPQSFSTEALLEAMGAPVPKDHPVTEALTQLEEAERRQKEEGIERLSGCGVFFADEMGAWLDVLDKSFNQGAKQMLTSWYDVVPWHLHKTKSSGSYLVVKPYLTNLVGTTPAWLTANKADLEGGFFPRWLLCYVGKKDYDLPFPDQGDLDQRQSVLNDLATIQKAAAGEFRLGADAFKHYREWYEQLKDVNDDRFHSWMDRMSVSALKIAMLYQATLGGDEISRSTLECACRLIDRLRRDLTELLLFQIGFSEQDRNLKLVMRHIRDNGKLDHSTLARKVCPMSVLDLTGHLNTLVASGKIFATKEETATKPRNVYTWCKEC